MFGGIRIIENDLLVDTVEDWSRVRSPSRALRRMRYGHRQNVKIVSKPKMEAFSIDNGRTLVMHPAMADLLRRHIEHQHRYSNGVGGVLQSAERTA